MVKNSPPNAEDAGLIPGSGRSNGEGNGNPLHYSCLGNLMDRSPVGYSPWGRKESNTTVTEQQHRRGLLWLLVVRKLVTILHLNLCVIYR